MVEIPDKLRRVFSATLDRTGNTYTIEVPADQVDGKEIRPGETYRVALLRQSTSSDSSDSRGSSAPETNSSPPEPPVEKGDIRTVEIESLGDEGDGIAKIDRGYVLIVSGARPGDEVTVEVQQAKENVGFAEIQQGI